VPDAAVRFRRAGLAGLIVLAAGCAAAGPSLAPAGPGAPRDSLRRADLPPMVWAVRDTIQRMLSSRRGMTVVRLSGRFEDPFGGGITSCRLMIHGRFRMKPPYDDAIKLLERYFERAGWKSDEECSADGPDGTVWGVRRGGVRCLVEGRWEGEDDSDTTYVPRPEYDVTVDCLPDHADICPH
jgi:hypothetical protein